VDGVRVGSGTHDRHTTWWGVGVWVGGWAARRSPHPHTHSGLEWSHVGTQRPYPAIAPQYKCIGESRTACGWGRGRLPGTHLRGVAGWGAWVAGLQCTPDSPPADKHPGLKWAHVGREHPFSSTTL
jgi:hypothetical protein